MKNFNSIPQIDNRPDRIKQASKLINFLLANNLEEKYSSIFSQASELELPLGVNKYPHEEAADEDFKKLKRLCLEAGLDI